MNPSLNRHTNIDNRHGVTLRQSPSAGRVLVVREGMDCSQRIIDALRRHEISTLDVADVAGAVSVCEAEPIAIVFVAAGLSSGEEDSVFCRLRRIRHESELAIVAVGDCDDQRLLAALDQGASEYLQLPTTDELIVARARTLLRLRHVQHAFQEAEERYFLTAQGVNDGLWDWRLDCDEAYYSPRWSEILGLDASQLLNRPADLRDRIHSEDRASFETHLQSHLQGKTPHFEIEVRLRHQDGNFLWMFCRGKAVPATDGIAARISGSMTDITVGKVADPVTGLPNRVLFKRRIQRSLQAYREQQGPPFAVMYVDLDNFKMVNDTLGHDAGDRLLISVARRLEGSVRTSESVVARLGGDEFALLVENIQSVEEAQDVADRILRNFQSPFPLGEAREVFASLSLGISIASERCETSDKILYEADAAMYEAKSQGKSCARLFAPYMRENASSRLQLERDLRQALECNEFELNFQPLVRLPTRDLVGFEALIRWRHPQMGMVLPANFIALAEETGLIVPISLWVLRQACQQQVEWKRQFPDLRCLKISINVSRRQVMHSDLTADLAEVIAETGIAPRELKLEISESTIMEDAEHGIGLLNDLRRLGVEVAIDDFGTGFSSLSCLHRLPLDSLKIDQSFVGTMASSRESRMIVGTIIALAEQLGLDVVAEGIETELQQNLLSEMGCVLGQGFLYSPPVAIGDADAMLRKQFAAGNSLPLPVTGFAATQTVRSTSLS
ncbi:putative bifunctional diguanylate cyclase/phosphodiesterase [Rosistilla oblonga]|uniref:putative bifunctional diguanylate cyclase/phosphodiesterase n=1 Tax=Rosistilla oblonga TaxID=2527990 RepID=UPI003A97867C